MNHVNIPSEEVLQLSIRALEQNGVSAENAESVARSVVEAELQGKSGIGLAHLFDYLDAVREGRIDGRVEPLVSRPVSALFRIDAGGGFAHPGVDRVFVDFVDVAKQHGISALGLSNGYTCGELGYFVRRLTEHGLLGLAAANGGPALLASSGSTTPVFCTNPLAFAVPRIQAPPLVIDQSSSATAYVNLRKAAESGETIPEGWALDSNGAPTTDPLEAIKGVLLAFGGERGANIALMVELLAAGVTGANWSLDAPSFLSGDNCPAVGLLIIALHADLLLGGDFSERVDAYLSWIRMEHQTHVPGEQRGIEAQRKRKEGLLVPGSLLERLQRDFGNSR